MTNDVDAEISLPVEFLESESPVDTPEPGMALCLSGGGYRAMLFHLGSLWRLYELGLLKQVRRIASVSGGSITSAMLGLKWTQLSFDPDQIDQDFIPQVVSPIRKLAGKTIDRGSVAGGVLLIGSIAYWVADTFRARLYGDKTLQDLPDEPRFVINATNVQSGALWRFMKPYMRDWRVGEVRNATVELAVAVAASSAFPPLLSPLSLELDAESFTPNSGHDLQRVPFTSEVMLTDGGVCDNLGLETCFKRYDTILVSDAGGKMSAEEEPKRDWARHAHRVLNLVDNQVRSLRKRQLIRAYMNGTRKGAYWGVRTDIVNYQLSDALPCPSKWSMSLARTPTRMKRLSEKEQENLINWGYAVCDAAIRKHVDSSLPAPSSFPYPDAAA